MLSLEEIFLPGEEDTSFFNVWWVHLKNLEDAKVCDSIEKIFGAYIDELSEKFIRHYIKAIDANNAWILLLQTQCVSEQFIEDYIDKLNWWWVAMEQHLSVDFIRKHKQKFDKDSWIGCILNLNMDLKQNEYESFLEEFKDGFNDDWVDFVMDNTTKDISKNFIIKYQDKITKWSGVFEKNLYDEDFLTKHKKKFFNNYFDKTWNEISRYQKLSYEFIKENIGFLIPLDLLSNKNLDQEKVKLIYEQYGNL